MIRTLGGYLSLMRLPNGLIAVLSVLVASLCATRSPAPGPKVLIGAAAAFLILGGGNALNDYFDSGIDAINKPRRPIPSGRVSRRAAGAFALGLFAAGLGLGLFLNAAAFALAAVNTGLLILYARRSKRMLFAANVLVAGLTASVFVFAGAILRRIDLSILALAGSAFFIMLTREILKDIEDLEGDRRAGAATLPIRWGVRRARGLANVFIPPAVAVAALPALLGRMDGRSLAMILLAAAGLGGSLFLPPRAAQLSIKAATLIVLLAFAAGSL